MPDATSLGTLVVLALIDSTSFGTLLIPIWLLLSPGRTRLGRVLLFLGTVVLAYFAIGVALMLGAATLLNTFDSLLETDASRILQLALGIALVLISYLMDNKQARKRAAERAATGTGRLIRWRARAMGEGEEVGVEGTPKGAITALLGLAMMAVVAEIATMIPYLAAIGIITTQGPDWPGNAILLAGYCLIMITPALLLTTGSIVARPVLEHPLTRLDNWLTKNAQTTTAWIIGIVGVVLGLQALSALGWISGITGVAPTGGTS